MRRQLIGAILLSLCFCSACRHNQAAAPTPPPDVRRPVLKTEAELAAEREEAVRGGKIVPGSSPTLEAERRRMAASPVPTPLELAPGAIQGDLLMVDQTALTAAEVLYPLREFIKQIRATQTPAGAVEQLTNLVKSAVQQEVGQILVFDKAMGTLDDPQKKALDDAVQRDLNLRISREFEGSLAKLAKHLERFGLTLDQYKQRIKRQIVVRSYTQEILSPRVTVRRDELFEYYRTHISEFSSPETRELRMIEAPFERFLPDGAIWSTASDAERAQARLGAVRQIRAAHAALAERPFVDVAREFSFGPHRDDGGSWGQVGRPLQPPYDQITRPIFEFQEEQYTEPLEAADGWYIAGCGKIEHARNVPFAEAQEKIREQLSADRFNRLANNFIMDLAQKATISSLDSFIQSVVRRGQSPDWVRASQ